MDMKLQESYMDFPTSVVGEKLSNLCRPARLDSKERQTLKAMSLVHRAWTGPARVALRRRSDVHSPTELKQFLQSRFCGEWVQEFFHFMQIGTVRDVVCNAHDNTLDTLGKVFERLPNLKALSLAMENLILAVGPFRLTPILSPAPRGLQVLHVYLHQWTDSSLCELRGVVSDLHRLTTLSIMGDCFTAYADDSQSLHAAQTSSPPASLKRLLLQFRSLTKEVIPHLSWLFTPQNGYSLHELRIRHDATLLFIGVRDAVRALLPVLSPVLEDLRILEVRLSNVEFLFSVLYCPESFQTLIEGCIHLEELHADIIDVPVPALLLPGSLKRLYVFKTFDAEENLASDDNRLVKILTPLLSHRNLRSVNISELESYDDEQNLFKTEELCIGAGIEYTVAENVSVTNCFSCYE